MLKLIGTLLNLPVISLRTGSKIALAHTPIINPYNLKIVGWWCRQPDGKQTILLAEQIREAMANGLAVNDEEALSDPTDLVRHKEILDINFNLMDKPVKTKRHKIGKVSDFSYNDGLFVQKLYVTKPMHKVFSSEDTLIIDRQQIEEVTNHYILIKDTDLKVDAKEMAPAGAVAGT